MIELQTYLEKIKTRLDNATPGPWYIDDKGIGYGYAITDFDNVEERITVNDYEKCGDDAFFIAHAPTDIKILIEMVEEFYNGLIKFEDPKYANSFIKEIIAKHSGSE